MEKKTIGGFISALRKANGMTQQEVADRLNISNKAVSRWERDECAPDLSLIPAIAELFGVSCDELLKGERISSMQQAEKSEPKVEKQLKALVNRTISSFKTMIWISMALAIVGYIVMLGISYGFYRPLIGFVILLLFETVAVLVTVIAINKMKEVKTDNELFEYATPESIDKFNKALGTLSFFPFAIIFTAIVCSIPLACQNSVFIYSVLSFDIYAPLALLLLLSSLIVCINARGPYISWMTNSPYVYNKHLRVMNLIHFLPIVCIIAAQLLDFYGIWRIGIPILLLEPPLMLTVIISFFVFSLKYKSERRKLIMFGLRNIILYCIAASLFLAIDYFCYWPENSYVLEVGWNSAILYVLGYLAIGVYFLFMFLDFILNKSRSRQSIE